MTRPASPPDIPTSWRVYRWQELDSAIAEHGAQWGLRGPKGTTFLLRPHDSDAGAWALQAVGLYSGHFDGSPKAIASLAAELDSLEYCAPGMTGADRRIPARVFDSWRKAKESDK